MRLIVDIPEDAYTRLFDKDIQDNEIAVDDVCEMARAIRLGTPCSAALAMAIKSFVQKLDAIHNEREQAYMKGYEDASKRYREEPCEDCISKAEARHLIVETDRRIGGISGKAFKTLYNGIDNLPPVTPKQKMGRWGFLDECANSGYYCSECHKKLVKEGWSDTVKKIKFCHNCGAKMEESEET